MSLSRPITLILIAGVRLYQVTLGPLMGGHCRFHPTCSAYALEALGAHPVHRALLLVLKRIGKCHPLGGGGFDPVPPTDKESKHIPN